VSEPIAARHLAVGLTAAALVAAAIALVVSFSPLVAAYVLVVLLGFELVVILPILLGLRRLGWLNRGSVLAVGFLLAAVPAGWFMWPVGRPGSNASRGGVDTLIDGVPTLAG
jgi:hypothetical protein